MHSTVGRRGRSARIRVRARAVGVALGVVVTMGVATPQAHADSPPRLLSSPAVTLPADGTVPEGASVLLEITVDAAGAVTDAVVVTGLGAPLDATVLDAARHMTFAPAVRGETPVPARLRFRFRLRPGAPPRTVPPAPANPYPGPAPVASENPAVPMPAPTPGTETPAGEATVRARREPGAATTLTLRAEELTTVPGTLGEPTRVVATLPGVARSPFGLGLFVVRGASFENTGYFIDGFPVPVLYHLGVGPAVISSRLVGELNFYPGGYPLSYGRFSAGVIALDTRPPPTDRPFAEFQVDLLKAGAMAVLPFDHGHGSLAVAARRSYYDLLVPLFVDGVHLSYGDYQVRMDYRFNARSRVSLFVFGSNDAFDRTAAAGVGATAGENQAAVSYTFHRAIGRWEYLLPGDARLSVAGALGWDDTTLTSTSPGLPDQGVRTSGTILGQRTALEIPTGPHVRTTLGLDIQSIAFTAALAIPLPASIGGVPPPAFAPDVLNLGTRLVQVGVAAYAQEDLHQGPVELSAGTRIESLTYGTVHTVVPDPRVVARVHLSQAVTLVAATGFFHQAPPFVDLVPAIGNPGLRPTRSWQSSLGVEANFPGHIETRVTGFYTQMNNLPRATDAVIDTPDGPRREVLTDDGQGRAYGMEVLLRRRIERGVYGWLSYTLSRSERFIQGGTPVPFTYDQTHVLNLAVSWSITDRWRVGARFQLTSGNPYTPVTGAFFDSDTDRYRPLFAAQTGDGSAVARLPTYHQLDIRVDYRFHFWRLAMTAYLDVLNVYNAQNTEAWLYQFDYARKTNFPGLPILPTLGLQGEL